MIPLTKEIKGNKYCKWHISYNYSTVSYIIIRRTIQKEIKEGRFKLADTGVSEISIYINPFPTMEMTIVLFSKLSGFKATVKGEKKAIKQVWKPKLS